MVAKKLIVLCDGTWCGPETGTESNIHRLAWMMGIDPTAKTVTHDFGNVQVGYFKGVGLSGSFMSYLWDAAFASNREKDCNEVYDYIVQNFTKEHEIWMFGLSRGAYTVRSVAGMINNCGIVQETTSPVIKQIYKLYRSPYAVNEPNSPEMQRFREQVSYDVQTPVKFMGLFDTVGSLGIPRLNYDTGVGFEWPEFHDNKVSSVVEKVYHAISIHDRFWAFQPCLASRDDTHTNTKRPDLRIYQKWFPGAHYDIGRQEFQFLREGSNAVERFINRWGHTVSPNEPLSDLVLLWMPEGIKAEGGRAIITRDMAGNPSDIDTIIGDMRADITGLRTGDGDIYDDIPKYFPLGKLSFIPKIFVWAANKILPLSSSLATANKTFFGTTHRVIPDPGDPDNPDRAFVKNEVYDYTTGDRDLNDSVIRDTALCTRYKSKTFENYTHYMTATGRNLDGSRIVALEPA
ncbi:hypothetical protein H2201_008250 [Coniosporium apollinis]|uniref:T6SS Phospholipase effector Tle1-like catalytic domain-containing protein n=1 Tax=Coniosporium apollinis TaxID=61459 RepID=A0ABQ9NLW6_9PEZI|nr:hypothetical protein H2201_008250 [Coniosporium apollinis]